MAGWPQANLDCWVRDNESSYLGKDSLISHNGRGSLWAVASDTQNCLQTLEFNYSCTRSVYCRHVQTYSIILRRKIKKYHKYSTYICNERDLRHSRQRRIHESLQWAHFRRGSFGRRGGWKTFQGPKCGPWNRGLKFQCPYDGGARARRGLYALMSNSKSLMPPLISEGKMYIEIYIYCMYSIYDFV